MSADDDAGFESFQRQLRDQVTPESAWWRLRDSLFATATYRAADAVLEKRHRLGLFSWSVWLVRQLLKPTRPKPPAKTKARFHFLFYGSHSAHFETLFPILAELSGHSSCCAWTLGLKPEQEKRLRGMNNVIVKPAHSDLGQLSLSERLRLCTRALRNVWKSRRLGSVFARLFSSVRSRVTETFLSDGIWNPFWSARLGASSDGAVFVTSESSVIAKSFMETARLAGARAIHFCHGLRHASHEVTRATDLCVFSKADKAWFDERVPPDCEVRAIGNPRLEQTRLLVTGPPPRGRGEPFHLLYFSQGYETPYTLEMKTEDLRILGSQSGQHSCHIRMRPHPREPLADFQQLVAEVGLQAEEFSRRSLEEDLSWAHAAGTSWSTALLEAAACGRYCYWINARDDDFGGAHDLRVAGVGKLVRTPSQWEKEVEHLLSLQTYEPALVSEATLRSMSLIGPGTELWAQRLVL